MKKIIALISFSAIAMASEARNLFLDLSADDENTKSVAYCRSALSGNEEVRSNRLQAGAAKVSGLEAGDVITFKLFADKTLAVTSIEETPSVSGRAFLGRIDNALGAIGCVVLETEEGIVLDVTDFENQRVWKVVSDADGVAVKEIKPDDTKRFCGADRHQGRQAGRYVRSSTC